MTGHRILILGSALLGVALLGRTALGQPRPRDGNLLSEADVWQPLPAAPARTAEPGDLLAPEAGAEPRPTDAWGDWPPIAAPTAAASSGRLGPALLGTDRAEPFALGPPVPSGPGGQRDWRWQLFPNGLLYPCYLAGMHEPRFGIQIFRERDQGWFFDATLGARIGLVRYGTDDPVWAEGLQLDVEAAALPRMSLDEYRDMIATDFRYGFPLTYRQGPVELKLGFYHLSSHLGDEYLLSGRPLRRGGPRFPRINYLRDTLVGGVAVRPTESTRLYAEAGWAFNTDDGSEPWEFQFGAEYSPYMPTGPRGSPFLAVNGHLREEADFGGALSVQVGWQWRLAYGRLVRTGFHYFNGLSNQYEFYTEHEEQFGWGVWYDF